MAAELSLPLLIGLIAVALAFDFLNGLHDTANSIATLVSTRMLRPRYAVIWAGFFNFIAFLVFGVHVARTVGVGIVSADVIDPHVIFGALMGAHPVQQLACPDRRPGRSRRRQRRSRLDRVAGPDHDRRIHCALAAVWISAGAAAHSGRVMGVRARQSTRGRADIPMAAICRRVAHFTRPWRQ
jgi:hypothetical protein